MPEGGGKGKGGAQTPIFNLALHEAFYIFFFLSYKRKREQDKIRSIKVIQEIFFETHLDSTLKKKKKKKREKMRWWWEGGETEGY